MKITFRPLLATLAFGAFFTSCKKDSDPVIVIQPSSGTTMTLNGGTGGSSAVNSVFLDLSTDTQDSIKRNSWDLGFYSGSDFKVIINNTNGASIKKLTKTDLNTVTTSDFNAEDLTIGLGSTDASEFTKVDDPREKNILNKTAIGTISATDADNKAIIIMPTGGTHASVISAENAYKIRIIRKGTTGYTLQYAKLSDATYKSIDITKDANYNFNYISLSQGQTASVEPAKSKWDIEWTWSIYYDATAGYIYSYSDIIFTNNLGNVSGYERVYADQATATQAFNTFNKDSVVKYSFLSERDLIGSKWRSTQPATGSKTDRFYIIKDAEGNYYKLKFGAMGVGTDGGTRGKPVIQYELIAQ